LHLGQLCKGGSQGEGDFLLLRQFILKGKKNRLEVVLFLRLQDLSLGLNTQRYQRGNSKG